MAGFSTYLQTKVLDHVRGKTAFTMPANHIALFTVNPTDAGGGTEAAYTGYARVSIPAGSWAAASGTSGSNGVAVTFPACTGGTSTVTGFGVYDAATTGNLLFWGTCSLSVSNGITPQFGVGDLVISLD